MDLDRGSMATEVRDGGTRALAAISSDQALTERLRCGTPRTSAEVGTTRSSGASTVRGETRPCSWR